MRIETSAEWMVQCKSGREGWKSALMAWDNMTKEYVFISVFMSVACSTNHRSTLKWRHYSQAARCFRFRASVSLRGSWGSSGEPLDNLSPLFLSRKLSGFSLIFMASRRRLIVDHLRSRRHRAAEAPNRRRGCFGCSPGQKASAGEKRNHRLG